MARIPKIKKFRTQADIYIENLSEADLGRAVDPKTRAAADRAAKDRATQSNSRVNKNRKSKEKEFQDDYKKRESARQASQRSLQEDHETWLELGDEISSNAAIKKFDAGMRTQKKMQEKTQADVIAEKRSAEAKERAEGYIEKRKLEEERNQRETARESDALARKYEKRKTDVVGRRQTRLKEREIRDNLVETYKERGIDIDPEVARAGYKNAKASEGWDGMDDFTKRSRMSQQITDVEANRRAWMSLDESVINDPSKVKFENGQPKIVSRETKRDFESTLEKNRQEIINGKKTPSGNGAVTDRSEVSINTTEPAKGSSVMNKYMTNKFNQTSADFNEAIKSGQLDEAAAQNYASRFKMGKQSEDFVNHVKNGDFTGAQNMIDSHKGNFISTPGAVDKMMGYKVPHMAGGALLTAGLVSSLSSSKGQQSNAQLYGQQQPYY